MQKMCKSEALRLVKLLSALESWSFATKPHLPDYLQDDLGDAICRMSVVILDDLDGLDAPSQSSRAATSDISGA